MTAPKKKPEISEAAWDAGQQLSSESYSASYLTIAWAARIAQRAIDKEVENLKAAIDKLVFTFDEKNSRVRDLEVKLAEAEGKLTRFHEATEDMRAWAISRGCVDFPSVREEKEGRIAELESKLANAQQDVERMDHLEAEAIHSRGGAGALFRRNYPITRAAVDKARARKSDG